MAAKFTYTHPHGAPSAFSNGWECGYFEGPEAIWVPRAQDLTYDEAVNMTNDLNHHLEENR